MLDSRNATHPVVGYLQELPSKDLTETTSLFMSVGFPTLNTPANTS